MEFTRSEIPWGELSGVSSDRKTGAEELENETERSDSDFVSLTEEDFFGFFRFPGSTGETGFLFERTGNIRFSCRNILGAVLGQFGD